MRSLIDAPKILELEAALKSNPSDLSSRSLLIDHYFQTIIMSEYPPKAELVHLWAEHALGIIEHHPNSEIAGSTETFLHPFCKPEVYEKGKQLWEQQVRLFPDNVMVLKNAAHFIKISDPERAIGFLESAYLLSPNDPEIAYQLSRSYTRKAGANSLPVSEKREIQKRAFELAQISLNVEPMIHFYRLSHAAKAAFNAGKENAARSYAVELLALADNYQDNWNYGNAILDGNVMLGKLALKEGKSDDACKYLLDAGNTPGSPQLNSFGPDFTLAKELLQLGKQDTVRIYLKRCLEFWKTGEAHMTGWLAEIDADKMPDFELRE